jgi:hypothetical protein
MTQGPGFINPELTLFPQSMPTTLCTSRPAARESAQFRMTQAILRLESARTHFSHHLNMASLFEHWSQCSWFHSAMLGEHKLGKWWKMVTVSEDPTGFKVGEPNLTPKNLEHLAYTPSHGHIRSESQARHWKGRKRTLTLILPLPPAISRRQRLHTQHKIWMDRFFKDHSVPYLAILNTAARGISRWAR